MADRVQLGRIKSGIFALSLAGALAIPTGFALAQTQEGQEPARGVPADLAIILYGPPKPDSARYPWIDARLSPDARADMVLSRLTQEEKIALLHGTGLGFDRRGGGGGGPGYVPGVPRLAIPALDFADSVNGVTKGALEGRYSTLLPSTLAKAATWSPAAAYEYGALIARELRAQGYNASLAFGANLMREPRGGRNFEYPGEDPVLAGAMTAQAIRGVQDQHVLATIKHFAINPQETGRHVYDAVIDWAAARESDLLAFEIGVRDGQPGMVMCAYNRVNGEHACENDLLLRKTLKDEWGFNGFVISDWVATHSTEKAILAGLDMEQPNADFFGQRLKEAVVAGRVPQSAVDASVRRILRAIFAMGLPNHPVERQVVDVGAGLKVAQSIAEQGAVLLKNEGGLLPLTTTSRVVAVIGGHADAGVLTGGGSGQVDVPGGNAVPDRGTRPKITADGFIFPEIYWPSSPLSALRDAAPQTRFVYDDGRGPARAAALARTSDMAIVFAVQHSAEEMDRELALPAMQNALISAVADANSRSVVVLQTGGPVTMPWLDKVPAVVEAWFPGASGAPAIARLLTGKVNFSGKLPVTFPRSEADLPHPTLPGTGIARIPNPKYKGLSSLPPFEIHYDEGELIGYKWHEAKGKPPLFAFGHGLSYTRFSYSGLSTTDREATFSVTNAGSRDGVEIAQVYASLPRSARRPARRLVGWSRVELQPGETRQVTVKFEPLALSIYDTKARKWQRPTGRFEISVGGSSAATPLSRSFSR